MEQIQVESQSSISRKITINIEQAEVERRLDAFYDDLKDKVVVPGFRKGKTPRSVLAGNFSRQARSAVSKALFAEYYAKALKDHSIVPVTHPTVVEADEEAGIVGVFSAAGYSLNVIVEVMPTVHPTGYKGMTLRVPPSIDTQAALDAKLTELRTKFAERKSVDRSAQLGDLVVVDFAGTIDGVAVPGLKEDGFTIEHLGGGSNVAGFDEQLVDLKVDEAKDFTLTFPLNNSPIAGKTAAFHVVLKRVIEVVPAALDDDLAMLAGYTTLAELQTATELECRKTVDRINRGNLELQIVGKLAQDLNLEVPESVVRRECDRILGELKNRGQQVNDGIRQNIENAARYNTARGVLMSAIYNQEPTLEITTDEFDAFLDRHAQANGKEKSEFVSALANSNQLDTFTDMLKCEKVLDYIINNATTEVVNGPTQNQSTTNQQDQSATTQPDAPQSQPVIEPPNEGLGTQQEPQV